MCGRFTLRSPADELVELFGEAGIDVEGRPNLAARFNIAPSQDIVVVRATESQGGGGSFAMLRWGLVPHWAGDSPRPLINARAETVAEKPSFRHAYRRRRCLVPADGYYEWRATPGGGKQPYHMRFGDDAPFAMAALWETWRSRDGQALESCAMITTEANRALAPIHHRMPVILAPEAFGLWLDGEARLGDLDALLRPYDGDGLAAHAVGPRVNSARHDDAACLDPADDGMLL